MNSKDKVRNGIIRAQGSNNSTVLFVAGDNKMKDHANRTNIFGRARMLFMALLMVLTMTATAMSGTDAYAANDTVYVATYDQLRVALEDTPGVKEVVVDPQAAVEEGEVVYGVEDDENSDAFYIGFDGPLTVSHDITITSADDVDVYFARSDSFRRDQGKPALLNIDSTGNLNLDGLITMTGEEVATTFYEADEENPAEFVFSVKSKDGTGEDNEVWNRGQALQGGFYIQNNGGEYTLGDDVIMEDINLADDVEGVEQIHEVEKTTLRSLFSSNKNEEEATVEESAESTEAEENTVEEPVVAPAPKRLMKNSLMSTTPTRGGDTSDQARSLGEGVWEVDSWKAMKDLLKKDKDTTVVNTIIVTKDIVATPIAGDTDKSMLLNGRTVTIKGPTDKKVHIYRDVNDADFPLFKVQNSNNELTLGANLVLSGKAYGCAIEAEEHPGGATTAAFKASNKYIGNHSGLQCSMGSNYYQFTIDTGGYLKCQKDNQDYWPSGGSNPTLRNSFDSGKCLQVHNSSGVAVSSIENNQTYYIYDPDAKRYMIYDGDYFYTSGTNGISAGTAFTSSVPTGASTATYWTVPGQEEPKYTSKDDAGLVAAMKKYNEDRGLPDQACDSIDKTWTSDNFTGGTSISDPKAFFVLVQTDGILKIEGATLEGFNTDKSVKYAAPIVVKGGSLSSKADDGRKNFVMSSGSIQNNKVGYMGDDLDSTEPVKDNSGKKEDISGKIKGANGTGLSNMTNTAGGVIFTNKATATISGGKIEGNKGDAGGIIVTEEAHVKFTNGKINSNIGVHHAGAAHVEHGGTLIMDGANAEMKNNIAWYKGGAVWATEWGTSGYAVADWSKWPNEFPTLYEDRSQRSSKGGGNFVLKNGTIQNNTAFARAGAIEVESNGVQLEGGLIDSNYCRSLGGAIYIEGDSPNYSYTLVLPNGYISGNEAIYQGTDGKNSILNRKIGETMDSDGNWLVASNVNSADGDFNGAMGNGGGVWLCPVGGTSVFTGGDIYIWNNDSQRSNATGKEFENKGGWNGGEDFYLHKGNGSAMLQLQNMKGSWFNEQTGKSINDGVKSGPLSMINTTDHTLGTNGVVITGNLARDGGAIACNGTFIIGQPKDVHRYNARLNLNKTWADGTDPKGKTVNLKLQYLYPLDGDENDENNWHDLKYMPASSDTLANYEVELDGTATGLTIEDAIGEIASTNNGRTWNAAAFIPLYIDHNGTPVPLYVLENPARKNYDGDDDSIDFRNIAQLDMSNEAHVGHLYYYIDEVGQSEGNGKKLDNLNIAKWNLRVAETVKVGNQDVTTNYRVETSDPEKGSASAYADNIVLKDPLDQTTIKSQFSITYTTSTFSQGLVNEVASADVVLTKKDDKNQPVAGARFLVVEAERDDTGDYRVAGEDGIFRTTVHNKTYDKKPEDETFSFDVKGLSDSDRIVSGADGKFEVKKLLPGHTYFLFEYETPSAYQTHYAPWLIQVSTDGKTVNVYAIDDEHKNDVKYCPSGGDGSVIDYTDRKVWRRYWPEGWFGLSAKAENNTISEPVQSHTIKNDTVKIELLKTDENGDAIEKSAKFTLYGIDRTISQLFDENHNLQNVHIGVKRHGSNNNTVLDPVISEATVNSENGRLTLDNLRRNTAYLLFETEAPEGYQREKAPWLICILEDGTSKVYKYGANTYLELGSAPIDIDNVNDAKWSSLRQNIATRWWPTKIGEDATFEEITANEGELKKLENRSLVVEFEKIARDNQELKLVTAEFDLYHAVAPATDPEETGYVYKIDPAKATKINNQDITCQDGKYTLPITQSGMYLLFEKEAPVGYVRQAAPWGIWVDTDSGVVRTYKLKDDKFNTYQNQYGSTTNLTQIEISKDHYERFTSGKLENRRKPIELAKVNENGEVITTSNASFVLAKAIQDSGSNNWYVFEGKAHPDRTLLDASRIGFGATAAKTYTTQNGKLTMDNLEAGNYLLFETNAPDGFVRTRTPWLIKVTKNDSTGCEWQIWRIKDKYTNMYKDSSCNNHTIPDTAGNEQKAYGMFWPAGDTGWFEAVSTNNDGSYNIKNEPKYLTKVDENTISSSNDAELIKLKGAKFHLYGTHTNTFGGYNYIRQDASKRDIQLETTDSDGKIKLPSSVTSTNGMYFLVEEQNGAPGGYYQEEFPWLLIVDNGSIRILATTTAHSYTNNYGKWWKYENSASVDQFKAVNYSDSYRIPNKRMPISLTKVDGYTGEKLGGAEFRVYKTTQNYYSSNVHYQTVLWSQYRDTSSLPETGKISFPYTDDGYYLVEELTPPDGYTITNKYWMVWIDTTYGYSNAKVYVFKAEKYTDNVYLFRDGAYLTECANDEIPNYPSVNLTKVDLKTVDIDVANDGSGKTTYGVNQDTIKLNGVGFQLFNATVSGNNWTQGTRVAIEGEDSNGISWTKKVGENDGVLELGSLGKRKEYLLVETNAKDGYIKPDYAWRLYIDKNGNLTKVEAVTGSNGQYVETNHILTNREVYDLPKTGGIGTYWFMIIGAMMMGFALTAGFTKVNLLKLLRR